MTAETIAAPSPGALRDMYLLDPGWTYLNHGSFGACPRPVFETYQRLQLELERQPVDFLDRTYAFRLDAARLRLASYLDADADGLVFVPNTTTGVNTVARALPLGPGDEVLITDHEYYSCKIAWDAIAARRGASVVVAALPLPLSSASSVVDALAAAATSRTKVVFFSHLASETGAVLPAAAICDWARSRGIVSLVDGAHAPGQLSLSLSAISADAYVGNCHKWMCAPKGSAFLWVGPSLRSSVDPLVISSGCVPDSDFATRHGWRGTHDPASVLSVPAAIGFLERHGWPVVRSRGHELAARFGSSVASTYGTPALYEPGSDWHGQLISVPVPWAGDPKELQRRLREEHRIEIPAHRWRDLALIRPSFGPYNDSADLAKLLSALSTLL